MVCEARMRVTDSLKEAVTPATGASQLGASFLYRA